MNPLISVIIPVYKVEDYLDECLSSVCGQTYGNLEIILVDDGSPDNCPQMCDEWAKRDKRIKVIHKENGGLSDARNAGMEIATGEYVAFVDSDDYIAPTMYETLINGFGHSDSIYIVSCQICTDREGVIKSFREEWNVIKPTILLPADFAKSKLQELTSHCVWNKLYKRDIIKNVRFKKGRNNEDILFMYELSKVVKEKEIEELILPDRLYYYRIMRQGSICASTTRPLMADMIDNLKYIMDDCKEYNQELAHILYPKYADYLLEFFNRLYANEVWAAVYFDHLKEQVQQVPLSYIWKNYSGEKKKHYLVCRLVPELRKKWLKKKNSYLTNG